MRRSLFSGLQVELIETVKDIFCEAEAGDSFAQGWLLDSFPAHRQFLKQHWEKKRMSSYLADGRPILGAPTPAQLAQQAEENRIAREQRLATLAAAEAVKSAERDKEAEAAFKATSRLKYATLSDADFDRLWPSRLRDDELIERAKASAAAALARPEYIAF